MLVAFMTNDSDGSNAMSNPRDLENQLAENPALLKAAQDWESSTDVGTERNESANSEALPRLPKAVWRWPFNEYWEAVKDSTEAPAEFHLASLLLALGAVIGRRAYIVSPTPIYPNLYVCLVGSTSDDRKSTAADLAVSFAERV